MDELIDSAESHHGVFTIAEAKAAGITKSGIQHRRAMGAWVPAAVGVVRVPGSPPTWEQSLTALVAAGGPGAAASHRSAAALLHIPGFVRSGIPEIVTIRARRHRGSPGVVHQSRILPEQHLTIVEGIRVTRTARTLLDLAGVLHPARTERAMDNCLAAGKVTLDQLRDVNDLLRARGRAGVAIMSALLDSRGRGYVAPESELEARFLHLVHSSRLEQPDRQVDAGDDTDPVGRIDFVYRRQHLVVEVDGRRHHTALLDRESDRRRDNRLVSAGWRVIRLSWDQIVNQPAAVVDLLRRSGVTLERWSVPK